MVLPIVNTLHVLNIFLMPLGCHVMPARFCQGEFVKHGKNEAMEKDRVEEDDQPSCFVAHNEPYKGENYLLKDR